MVKKLIDVVYNMNDSQITMNDRNYDFFEDYYKRSTEKEKLELSLSFIVEKLNEKSMSAIVGAGFSLNSNSSFPDWANLLVDAYKEMNPKGIHKGFFESGEKYNRRIANEIRRIGEPVVAAEYEKYKGKRESLDVYIEDHILQKQRLPQNLTTHEEFLKLNWCDIITTNWDNLLEKADKSHRYEVVCSAKDLKLSNKDRIVKIHGSFREKDEQGKRENVFDDCYDHLYLITEKDYENYPINHEGFSNFMKVKILENSFCLFGFSGSDWNFRYWVRELKRIMTKGGNTSNLNPIFLFDVSDKPYELDQKRFFKNNYIVPIKLDDAYRILGGPISDESSNNPAEKFLFIFQWLFQKKNENDVIKYGKKKLSDNKILQNIAYASEDSISKELMLSYINLPKFEINNLYYTTPFANKIQLLSKREKQWGEIEYTFLYTWCENNFFSLIQLFHVDVIERIVKHFIEKRFYLTEAAPFSELIFDYYDDCGKIENSKKLASLIESDCEDIVVSQKCKYYFKQLEYENLRDTLKNWFPEKRVKINPLHILCKIKSLLVLENIFDSNIDYGELFEIALKGCGENKQLLGIILLYYRYCKDARQLNIDSRLTELVNGLDMLDFDYPKQYIDLLIKNNKKDDSKSVLPNIKKRYQSTTFLSNDNYEEIKYRCFLNFFDYLNLTMDGIVLPSKFNEYIGMVDDYCLYRMFAYSFGYFGSSSDEENIQAIVPLFMRRFSEETKIFLFEKYLELFKYKIENKENPKILCFFINEIAKRIEKKYAKKYFNLFFKFFSQEPNSSLQKLAIKGRAWGIREPFVDYLRQIDEEQQFNYMINWTIDRCLETTKDNVELRCYQKYFHVLLNNKNAECYLKKIYKEESLVSRLVKNFESHYFLVLDAFAFIDDGLKNWSTEFLKKNMSLEINPIFLKKCFSEEAKERIVSIIEKKDYHYISSAEWPAVGYLRCLKELGKLYADDLRRVSPSINKLADIYSGPLFVNDYYKLMMKPYYELVCEIFESDDFELKSAIEESIKVFRPIYERKANEILGFDWMSTQDMQTFRDSFADSFAYSTTLNRRNDLIPYIGLVLARIFLDDDRGDVSKYEAVLELFISYCEYEEWFDLIKRDSTIKFGIVRIMRKFMQNIPLCYDDLFIRDKMFKLADIAKKMGVEDDSLVYWKKESNADVVDSL